MSKFGRNVKIGRSVRIGKPSAVIPTAIDPLSIVTSRSPFFYLIGDLGVTVSTGVSGWADQTGNSGNASQATGSAQPAYNSSDPNFGNRGSVTADGVNDYMTVAWNPPAPGTTNIWFFCIMRQIAYSAGTYLVAGGNHVLAIAQTPSTPTLRQLNTPAVNANSGAGIGSSVRLEALFSSSTSDYLKCGTSSVTGASAGNTDASTFFLFSRGAVADTYINSAIACIGAWNGEPTSGEKSALDAWVTSYYSGSVTV